MKDLPPLFDRGKLALLPLSERQHDLDLSIIREPASVSGITKKLVAAAQKIKAARKTQSEVIMMFGAHVLRRGVQRFIIDLMEQGYITCLSTNGAGLIHDFEFALIGRTTESVSRYIKNGQFGLWRETGRINDLVSRAADNNQGLGAAVGREIWQGDYPHKEISVLAAAHRLAIPLTVHVGIGYDIVYEHPNCDGGAWGKCSYNDFLRYAKVLENISGGVVMNFGSAIMAPEVFLKALAMVRNAGRQDGRLIDDFSTLVCDLRPLPPQATQTEAKKDNADYFFRPWKTMLVRALAGQGESFYVQGDHAETVPGLWTALGK